MVIRWACRKCGRTGLAALLRKDPKPPGVRAYLAHKARNPAPGQIGRCTAPSLTWKIAEPDPEPEGESHGDEKNEHSTNAD